jgi:trimethylamine:corrinoid methyltransferase-like protein
LACHSIEKLVIDAEAIAGAQRLLDGIEPRTQKLALDMFAQTGLHGDFLKLKETRSLFRKEQHFPSAVIDRGSDGSTPDIVERARQRADELVAGYRKPSVSAEDKLKEIALREANRLGIEHLPGVESAVASTRT